MSEWISVQDRLPELKRFRISDVVLAYSPTHGKCLALMYDRCDGAKWFCGGVEQDDITYWMAIPPVPNEEW